MYDALVKRLRDVAVGGKEEKCDSCPYAEDYPCCVDCLEKLHKQAADAIDKLSKYADTMRRLKCEGWYLQQTKFHDGYHDVSTMPLPEPPKEEQ